MHLIRTLVRAYIMTAGCRPTDAMVDGMLALVRADPCWRSVTLKRAPWVLLRGLEAAAASHSSRGKAIAAFMSSVLTESGMHYPRQHHLHGHHWMFGWHRDVRSTSQRAG